MDLRRYLDRINVTEIKKPDLNFLKELQTKHMLSVPFEDLDVYYKIPITVDAEKFYNKIVNNKRGGFCYELNGLFGKLLIQLGFKVDRVSARVYNSEKDELGPEFDHMALLVHLDKTYLTDVGFGDSFRTPIEMPDGINSDISGSYRITHKSNDEFILQQKKDNDWIMQYTFTPSPRELSDFENMCKYQQTADNSSFRYRKACTIATAEGRITLTKETLTITKNNEKIKREIKDDEEYKRLLYEYFKIKIKKEN